MPAGPTDIGGTTTEGLKTLSICTWKLKNGRKSEGREDSHPGWFYFLVGTRTTNSKAQKSEPERASERPTNLGPGKVARTAFRETGEPGANWRKSDVKGKE